MKRIKFHFWLVLVLCLCISQLFAQAPTYSFASSAGGRGTDGGLGVAVDQNGNTYVSGRYSGDTMVVGSTIFTNSGPGYNNIFLIKYDQFGNAVWAKTMGEGCSEYFKSVRTDVFGNCYVAGQYCDSIVLDSYTLFSPPIIIGTFRIPTYENFLVKYDPFGNVSWALSTYSGGTAEFIDMNFDKSGNAYLTGIFDDSLTIGTTSLTTSHSSSMFVSKLDNNGNVQWLIEAGYPIGIDGELALDSIGNIYISGDFHDSLVVFGTNTLINTTAGKDDIFILKLDKNGQLLWAKSEGGNNDDAIYSIDVSSQGILTLTGWYKSSSITFGSNTFINTSGDQMYVVQYDTNGNLRWASSTTSYSLGYGISMDSIGNTFVTGMYRDSIRFGSNSFISNGDDDIFVVKYNANGVIEWVKSVGGPYSEAGIDIVLDSVGNIYITGFFGSDSIDFDGSVITNYGGVDVFVAKLGNSPISVNELQYDSKYLIYPNPTQDLLTFLPLITEGSLLEIYDIKGVLIFSQIMKDNSNVDVSFLKPGSYVIGLKNKEDVVFRKRFIKI